MQTDYIDLYTDFLISANGQSTATGLSAMLEGDVSHDQITRFLSSQEFDSRELWLKVKKTVRQIEREDACLIFDDTIQEKVWTDENEVICWHYDHTKNRNVKGINLLNALYYSEGVSVPVGFEIVHKPIAFSDLKTRRVKRKSEVTKNELMRSMINTAVKNHLKFGFVLMDSWFAATDNFAYIRKYKKHFIAALKSNRLFALSAQDKAQGRFGKVGSLDLSDKQAVRGYLKGYDQEVLLVRRTFTNKDGSTGTLDLVCSDTTLSGDHVATIYEKRWKVEEFFKSLKSNAALAKSPTRTVRTQSNHVFMAIFSVFKLECLKLKHSLNHFALKSKLLIKANQIAFSELRRLSGA